MIDHILLNVIGAIRTALEGTLLEQQAFEERFQVDVFLGDVSFETSYSLPGEQSPPRVRADLSFEWPTWSQSAYRSWSIGEPPAERPELIVEVSLRLQRLAEVPDPAVILAALGSSLPEIAGEPLERAGPSIEQLYGTELDHPAAAVEVAFQGAYHLDEATLENPAKIETEMSGLARWIASGLVRLADLDLPVLPADNPSVAD